MLSALLLHIALAFPADHPFSPLTVQTATAEAATLWSPYGVAIDDAVPCGRAGDGVRLIVVAAERSPLPAPDPWRGPLGAVSFDPDGNPAPVITVFVRDIHRFVSGTRVLGAL